MKLVQRRTKPEPFELGFAEGVIQFEGLDGTVGVRDDTLYRLVVSHVGQSNEAYAVVLEDLVVVRGIRACTIAKAATKVSITSCDVPE